MTGIMYRKQTNKQTNKSIMKYIANAIIIFGLLWIFSEKETTETEFIFQIVGGLVCLCVGSLIHSLTQSIKPKPKPKPKQ